MVRSLFLCFAHPDDEAFLTAGTSCRYAADGVEVVLCTATRGEAGKTGDPPRCAPEDLAAVREAELREAAGLMGVSTLHLLGYADRDVASVAPDAIRARLVALIRRHRPAVVITFDPHGGNGHPDHVAISRFAIDAAAAASDGRWVPEAGPAHTVSRLLWTAGRRPWELSRLADAGQQPGVDFVIDVSAWRARKAAALRAHATQHLSTERNIFAHPDADRLLGLEAFRQAWGPALRLRPATDLFEGLAVD